MKTITIVSRLFLPVIFIFFFHNINAQIDTLSSNGMNNKKMDAIFKAVATEMEGQLGNWQMIYREGLLLVLTDETNNRMRIFSPVIEEKKLKDGQMKEMLEANFHSALDSKYSLYEGYVVSVFTHPLKELTKDQLIDAMDQVMALTITFGDTYSSTGLIFAPKTEEEVDKEKKEKNKKLNKKPKKM